MQREESPELSYNPSRLPSQFFPHLQLQNPLVARSELQAQAKKGLQSPAQSTPKPPGWNGNTAIRRVNAKPPKLSKLPHELIYYLERLKRKSGEKP
jgi:hypothetical protein